MRDGRCLFEVVDGVPVVTAPEEIDITNTPELRSALLEASEHGHGTFVVDMTRTQFCDSSGLHTLLAAHKRAQAEGGELLLAITAAPVLRVLAMTSIDRMIPNFTSLDEALAQTSASRLNGHQRANSTLPDLSSDRARAPSGRARAADVTGLTELVPPRVMCARTAPHLTPQASRSTHASRASSSRPSRLTATM
jgi:anti-sigma B factor antagonist